MTPAQTARQILTEWLEGEGSYQYCTRLVSGRLHSATITGGLCADLAHRFGCNRDELPEELVQEFVLFLQDDFATALDNHPDQVNELLNNNIAKILQQALTKFFWRLQDKARHKDSNPRAYLHRRLRNTVHHIPGCIVEKDARGRLYIYLEGQEKKRMAAADFPRGMDYGDWLPPPDPANRDELFKTAWLKKALHHFLDQACDRFGQPVTAPLNEVGRYLAAHFHWLNLPRHDAGTEPEQLAAPHYTPEEETDYRRAVQSIQALASQFYLTMQPEERIIFLENMVSSSATHQETARRLGLPDHNHVYRRSQKILKRLRRLLHNWPGPPVNELDAQVSRVFIEQLRKLCEKPEP